MEIRALLPAALLGLTTLVSGCVVSTDPVDGADQVDTSASEASIIADEIQKKYGVRPKEYASAFNAGNGNEIVLHRELGPITQDMQKRLEWAAAEYGVEMVEIASTFLTSMAGAAFEPDWYSEIVAPEPIKGLDDNLEGVLPFLPPDVLAAATDPKCLFYGLGDEGENNLIVSCLDFRQSLAASAAYYVWSKGLATKAMMTLRKQPIKNLPLEAQLYWATVFYRFGEAKATAHMQKYGIDVWSSRWDKADNASKYWADMRYDVTWRTATAELLNRTVFGHLNETEAPHDTEPGCIWSDSQIDWPDDRSVVTPTYEIVDSGIGRFGGYLTSANDVDWYAVKVTEGSYGAGMCIRATIDAASAETYRLCVAYDGPLSYTMCTHTSGVVQFDADRALADDSGTYYLSVARNGPIDECREYLVDWSVSVETCKCIGAQCLQKSEE